MLLGALVGGSDWGRHTIRTALLQRPGRPCTFTGQALGVTIAAAASIALTFLLAAAASAIIALHQTGPLAPAGNQFPAFGHVTETLAAALVLGLAYTAAGRALGVWLRSATAATGAVLLWPSSSSHPSSTLPPSCTASACTCTTSSLTLPPIP